MSLASLNFRVIVQKRRKGSNPITVQPKTNNWKFWSREAASGVTLDPSVAVSVVPPVSYVTAAGIEVLVEHECGLVFWGHAPENGMCSNGRGVPEPHHPPRQHPQPPCRGAAAPP
jgi:hypothetical protein